MAKTDEIPSQVVIELDQWLKAMSPYKRKYMHAAMKARGEMDLSLTSVPEPVCKRTKPVCCECESDDVIADASAFWDATTQEWKVNATYEKGGWCEACGGQDVRFDWVDAD